MVPPPTPYLRVDLDRLRRNVERAADRAVAARVSLRPHAKTHKCRRDRPAAARLRRGRADRRDDRRGGGLRRPRLRRPLHRLPAVARRPRRRPAARPRRPAPRLAIGVDSVRGAANAGRAAGRLAGRGRRRGRLRSPPHRLRPRRGRRGRRGPPGGLGVRGVFTFPGHSYAPDGRGRGGPDEARRWPRATASMARRGSPPAWSAAAPRRQPGARRHVGADRAAAGGLRLRRRPAVGARHRVHRRTVALTCRATVVSHAGGRAVLDVGSKTLGADRAAYATGWGRLLEHPERAGRACSPSTTRSSTWPGARCRALGSSGGRRAQPRAAPRSTSPTSCGSRRPAPCGPGAVAARGRNA